MQGCAAARTSIIETINRETCFTVGPPLSLLIGWEIPGIAERKKKEFFFVMERRHHLGSREAHPTLYKAIDYTPAAMRVPTNAPLKASCVRSLLFFFF